MQRLQGKAVVITGAAGGIGRAGALLFGVHGADLILADRAPEVEATAATVREAGGRAVALVRDVAQEADVADCIEAALREYGRLDVCYANAGISGGFASYDDLTADDWMHVLSVNLVGTALAVKHAARIMVRARRGAIVCTTSVAGLRSAGGPAPYSASKAGVISLVQTSALQLAGTGVRVNAVCPGLIDRTGMGGPIFELARTYGIEQQFTGVIPLRRGGLPEEVAHAALFLASDDASYVNGHILTVDGGLSSSLPGVPVSAAHIPPRRP